MRGVRYIHNFCKFFIYYPLLAAGKILRQGVLEEAFEGKRDLRFIL